jgi:toxin HigB-1
LHRDLVFLEIPIDWYTGFRYNWVKFSWDKKMAIQNFKTKGTEDINYGSVTKEALRTLPNEMHRRAQIKLARLGAVTSMKDLQEIRGNRFEKLKGERHGQYSIRINDQYRICFKWEKENAVDVEIVDYH